MNNVAQNDEKSIIGAIKIDKKEVQEHMDKLVRESVEEDVLNKLLDAEADGQCAELCALPAAHAVRHLRKMKKTAPQRQSAAQTKSRRNFCPM